MVNDSRISIYNYLYGLLYDNVSKNVYYMNEPTELTKSDAADGFIVITVGDIYDESEFSLETFGMARCYVQVFVPAISRGRVSTSKYGSLESAVNEVIHNAEEVSDGTYHIQSDSILSTEYVDDGNADNLYFVFVKSFIVEIEQQPVTNQQNQQTPN